MENGLWLAEVFRVLYQGFDELKPNRQIGTIKVNDEVSDQYLYKVNKIDKRKPDIQHLDEVVLTGPRLASISAENSFTIEVDLFGDAYKDSFFVGYCPTGTGKTLKICSPLERRITSKDGRGEIIVLYAIFDNATEAHLEVKLLADNDFTTEVYGVVAASTSKIKSFEFSSVLFLRKPSDKVKVWHCKLLPLSRSIVAVPLESELILDIHLMTDDEHDLFKGTVKFQAERTGTRKQLVDGKKCKIQVKVIWKCA